MPLTNAPASGRNRGVLTARRLSQTARNRRRRRQYVPTGNPPGRPRRYRDVVRKGHHAYRTKTRVWRGQGENQTRKVY